MAIYVDIEPLIKGLELTNTMIGGKCNRALGTIIEMLKELPTEDVITRGELRAIFDGLENTIMNPNWASPIYKQWYFAEVKKRHTEKRRKTTLK